MTQKLHVVSWAMFSVLVLLDAACPVSAHGAQPKDALSAAAKLPSSDRPVHVQVNSTPIRQHKAGEWSVLGVVASNLGSREGEAMVAVFFPGEGNRQFARRVWVPANSRRKTWLPVQLPSELNPDRQLADYRAISLDPKSGREILQRYSGELLVQQNLLSITDDPVRSAAYFRPPIESPSQEPIERDPDAWDTLMAARKVMELPLRVNEFRDDFLAPWASSLNNFDQFLLTTDRIVDDAAGLAALRMWVRQGGQLWITLDRMRLATAQSLLGNALPVTAVDRVELDRVALDSRDDLGRMSVREVNEYDQPVEFLRVVTDIDDVPCRIEGWPAAMRVPFGEGEVLFTTLGPRGWCREDGHTPTAALRSLAYPLFENRAGRGRIESFQPMLEQRIGYRVPGRSLATIVLGVYCVGLALSGAWLFRRGRPEQFAWFAPLVSVVAAGVLLVVGVLNSTSVPPTIAFSQWASVSPETEEVFSRGLVAVYDQRNRPVQWTGQQRSQIVPRPTLGAEVRRQVWTSNDTIHTQNAATQAGSLSYLQTFECQPLPGSVRVSGRFGPEGLEGQVLGDRAGLTDVVVLAPGTSPIAIKAGADGKFVSRPRDVLRAGQYMAGSLLTDAQRGRQNAMRSLFEPKEQFPSPRFLSVAAWRSPFVSSVALPEGYRVEGDALAVLPLELMRTPPGGVFRIPSTFLKASLGLGGGQSVAFNSRTGQWMRKPNRPTEVNMNFQLPHEVLPCKLDGGLFSVRISAPSREFRVFANRDGKRDVLKSLSSPSGVYDFSLGPEHLVVDDLGRVHVGISVGEDESGGQDSTWQIEYANLSLDGRALEEDRKR